MRNFDVSSAGRRLPLVSRLQTSRCVALTDRQWEKSRSGFVSTLAIVFDDGPSATLLTRLDTLENLAEDWDGLWHLDHK
jgi:hypothetical protein